jgi:hypothetical protein
MTGVAFAFLSSIYSVAMIDGASGLATGEAVGTAYISAYSGSVTSKTASLTVSAVAPPPPITLARLSPNIGLVGMNGDYKSLTIVGTGFISGAVVKLRVGCSDPDRCNSNCRHGDSSSRRLLHCAHGVGQRDQPRHRPRTSLPFYIPTRGLFLSRLTMGTNPPTARGCIFDAAGIKSTLYIITTLVGDTIDGYVPQSQLQAL